MITAKMGQYDLIPTFEFDAESQLIADSLPSETELKLKQRINDLRQEILMTPLTETDSEMATKIQQMNFLKGKCEAFMELLEDSQEAKTRQFASS